MGKPEVRGKEDSRPRLSVRAFAELMSLPGYEQLRILHEQKYPRREPQIFRVSFYQPAAHAIREYYRSGNSLAVLAKARQRISGLGLETRRKHNLRVITAFERSAQARRNLAPRPTTPYQASISGVELRLAFDLVGSEVGSEKRILFNVRTVPIDEDVARTTIEVAHWVLGFCGESVALASLEYVDFAGDRVFRYSRPRTTTLKRAGKTARVIQALWSSV